MFPNINAEQARLGKSNSDVANFLGISRSTYENKKKNGKFNRVECVKLIELFGRSFDYLFSDTPEPPSNKM